MFQQLFEIKIGFVFELLFSKLGPIVVKKSTSNLINLLLHPSLIRTPMCILLATQV